MPLPLLPLQILWINLVTDGLPALALAVEPPEPGVMRRPPTPLGESLLGADRGRRILLRGAALTVLVLVPAYLLWSSGDDAWQTVLFISIAFAELAGGFAMRSEVMSLRHLGVFTNRALVGAVGLTAALQVLLIRSRSCAACWTCGRSPRPTGCSWSRSRSPTSSSSSSTRRCTTTAARPNAGRGTD